MTTQQVRIIGGRLRGRKIKLSPDAAIRPTPNRVRETLFNWLMHDIRDAYCLDLFAGSGALSFEALSRGAKLALLVDHSTATLAQLRQNAKTFALKNIEFLQADSTKPCVSKTHKFNIVFLDPPFHKGYLQQCINWLVESDCLAPDALIYIEAEKQLSPLPVPDHWQLLRSQTAGQVRYHLLRV